MAARPKEGGTALPASAAPRVCASGSGSPCHQLKSSRRASCQRLLARAVVLQGGQAAQQLPVERGHEPFAEAGSAGFLQHRLQGQHLFALLPEGRGIQRRARVGGQARP